MFDPKGQILVDASHHDPESVMLAAIDAGAEDVIEEEGFVRVMTPFTAFQAVQDALRSAGIEPEEAELAMIPKSTVSVEGPVAGQVLRLVEALEDDDDVQKVAANFDIDEKILAAVG
jgi:transcriptional/translational regulatory protein YebC/TACO1